MLKSVTEARLPAILSDNNQKYILTPGEYTVYLGQDMTDMKGQSIKH